MCFLLGVGPYKKDVPSGQLLAGLGVLSNYVESSSSCFVVAGISRTLLDRGVTIVCARVVVTYCSLHVYPAQSTYCSAVCTVVVYQTVSKVK